MEISMKRLNELKEMPMEYRMRGEEFRESGLECTADDYDRAADAIELLLGVIGVPAFIGVSDAD
jgi:hypothetical protein